MSSIAEYTRVQFLHANHICNSKLKIILKDILAITYSKHFIQKCGKLMPPQIK